MSFVPPIIPLRKSPLRSVPHAAVKPVPKSAPSPSRTRKSSKPPPALDGTFKLLPLSVSTSFAVGYVTLPALSGWLSPLSPPQILVTGAFLPITGILFATFATTAVSVLHTRQINLRSALMTELANVRLLQTLAIDPGIRELLREYVECLKKETFERVEDLVNAYENSELVLWTCVRQANERRLRSEVEVLLQTLVTLRAQRRALVEACLPEIHFVITAILGLCLLLGFVFLIPIPTPTTRVLFGLLAGMQTLCYWLLGDLQGEWGGEYKVDYMWMMYTERHVGDKSFRR